MERQRYPLGRQVFSDIRKENLVYIDKTEYIYNLTHDNCPYMCLTRPRCFGKTLLLYTIQSYFEGRKELFKGLAIEKLEKEWTQYPVIHLNMSLCKFAEKDDLPMYFSSLLRPYEEKYGITDKEGDSSIRFATLIRTAYEQTGKRVVVLIDEYDAPFLNVIEKEDSLDDYIRIMHSFYGPLKSCDAYLHFVLLAGTTKIESLSIFSGLNNFDNIGMDEKYAAICGITQEELEQYMRPGIEKIAKAKGTTYERALQLLKDKYDGYHFTMPSPDLYNPLSLLNALSDGMLDYNWVSSGSPTMLIEVLKRCDIDPRKLDDIKLMESSFFRPAEKLSSPIPFLYQNGYITIKEYEKDFKLYTLSIPDKEMRMGLMRFLLSEYLGIRQGDCFSTIAMMIHNIFDNDLNKAFTRLQQFLDTLPPCNEDRFQRLVYAIFSSLGYSTDMEIHATPGRQEIVMNTPYQLYIMELKFKEDATEAIQQIDLKQYDKRFALCNLPVVKAIINFDCEKHTIAHWVIE